MFINKNGPVELPVSTETLFFFFLGGGVSIYSVDRTYIASYLHLKFYFHQDIKKNELYIAFYLDNDNPAPYFTWDDLKPGRFICIKNGRLRHFTSGDTGIRVEDADTVSFVDVKKETV